MTIYLLNSFPNSLQPSKGEIITIVGTSTSTVVDLLTEKDYGTYYNGALAPLRLRSKVVMAIGHQSVANLIHNLLDNEAYTFGACIPFRSFMDYVPVNRVSIQPVAGDKVICLLSVPSRRLSGKDDRWTTDEVSSMSTKWVVVNY